MLRPLLVLCGPVFALSALGRTFHSRHLHQDVHTPTLSVSVKNVVQGQHGTNGSHSVHDIHTGYSIKHVNSGAHVTSVSQALNRSHSKFHFASEAIQKAMEDFIDGNLDDPGDLEDQLEKKAEDEGVDVIVTELGDKLPQEVSSLVKIERTDQPADEAMITKARGILNQMIEKSQVALDIKTIECKEFKLKNMALQDQVNGDLSRLGSMLADLGRQGAQANQGIGEADKEIQKIDEHRSAEVLQYQKMKKADDEEMAKRKKELEVTTFILRFTRCPDMKLLLQQPSAPVTVEDSPMGTCELPNGADEMHFDDEEMEAEAQKLSPEAREQLWVYLGNSPSNKTASLQMNGESEDDDIHDDDDDNDDDDAESFDGDFGVDHLIKLVKDDHNVALLKQAPAALPKNPKPSTKKCTMGKPNCGLLYDRMSLLWGKMKDAVDVLQIKMDKDAAAHAQLLEDLNTQVSNVGNQKGTMISQQAGATSETSTIQEEQKVKQDELRILKKEKKNVMGECKQTIYEILYTNICGVKKVRGEISKKSALVKPDQIVDCEVSEWIPQECSKKCDDSCSKVSSSPSPSPSPSPSSSSPCGGIKLLTRTIVQKPNEYGAKCPTMTMNMTCGQIPCPVNCEMGVWSGWTLCTKECGGGLQSRSRPITVKPKNKGSACEDTQESQSCNTGSCERNCELSDKWEPFSACSQMCGGGVQSQIKKVKVKSRAGGTCPKPKSPKRYRTKKCNIVACTGDEKCIAKVDLVIAVDGSGSISEKGFKVLRDFTGKLVSRFSGRAYGVNAMQVGVVLFGNGKVKKDGTIQDGKIVSPLSGDMKAVQTAIGGMVWRKGFTNLAQAFTAAQRVLGDKGRKHANSAILVLTDGKPSFKVQTFQAVEKIRKNGITVNIVSINAMLSKPDRKFIKSLVSPPVRSNFVSIGGLTKVKRAMDKYVTKVLVQTCSKAESPTQAEKTAQMKGYKFLREGAWCGEKPEKGKDPNRIPLSEGPVDSADTCAKLAIQFEAKYFSLGTDPTFNFGQCYKEVTIEDDEGCKKTGWAKTTVNTYEILPPLMATK